MRHLGSLLAALVVAPAAWILLSIGQPGLVPGTPSPEKLSALAAAGLLLGLVATTRISPVGPLVAGLAYAGTGLAALWSRDLYDLLPEQLTLANRTALLRTPVQNGTAIVLGVLLLATVVSVRRWQPRRKITPMSDPFGLPAAIEAGPVPAAIGAGPSAAAGDTAAAGEPRPSPRHAAADDPEHVLAHGPDPSTVEPVGPPGAPVPVATPVPVSPPPVPSGVRPFPGLSRPVQAAGPPPPAEPAAGPPAAAEPAPATEAEPAVRSEPAAPAQRSGSADDAGRPTEADLKAVPAAPNEPAAKPETAQPETPETAPEAATPRPRKPAPETPTATAETPEATPANGKSTPEKTRSRPVESAAAAAQESPEAADDTVADQPERPAARPFTSPWAEPPRHNRR